MTRMVVVVTLLMVVAAACSQGSVLTLDDDGDRVSLAPSDEIQVTLAGNATTGFSWELIEYDPAVITPLGEPTYEEDDGELAGAGGEWTWTLRAVAAGDSQVRFVYHRAWEDEQPESVFSFVAAVDE